MSLALSLCQYVLRSKRGLAQASPGLAQASPSLKAPRLQAFEARDLLHQHNRKGQVVMIKTRRYKRLVFGSVFCTWNWSDFWRRSGGLPCIYFFFLWCGRNCTRLGPYNCVSGENESEKDPLRPRMANPFTTKTTKSKKSSDPQIPQPDLRFAANPQQNRGRAHPLHTKGGLRGGLRGVNLFLDAKSVWTYTSRFVRVAHAWHPTATTIYTLLELELHWRKWFSPRLDTAGKQVSIHSKENCQKLLTGVQLGSCIGMPVQALFLWNQPVATTCETL